MLSIKGKIIDLGTSHPVEEATVLLKNEDAAYQNDIAQLTSADGSFLWKELTKGNYVLQIYAEGYQNKSVHFSTDDKKALSLKIEIEKEH